jgi:hypothetical protein
MKGVVVYPVDLEEAKSRQTRQKQQRGCARPSFSPFNIRVGTRERGAKWMALTSGGKSPTIPPARSALAGNRPSIAVKMGP